MADVLVIYWDLDRPEAVTASPVGDSFQIIASWCDTDPAQRESRSWGSIIRELKGLAGPTVTEAIVVLPRDLVMVRKVEVPQAPPEDLPDLVRFQALTKLSVPLENLIIDYLPLPIAMATTAGMQPALVFAISRDQMQEMKSAISGAGLTLTRCCVSTLVCAAGARALTGDVGGAQLAVYQRGETVELAVVDQGNLIFTHTTQLSHNDPAQLQPVQAELTRSIIALQQFHPEAEINEVVLYQDPPSDQVLLRFLAERYAERLIVAGLTEAGKLITFAATVGEVAAPLWCGLLPRSATALADINFLAPRNRPEVRSNVWKRWAIAGGAVAAILLMLLWSWWGGLVARDNEIAELKGNEASQLDLLKTGQPIMDSAQVIMDWQTFQISPTNIFAELEPMLPGTDRLYFQELKWSTGQRGARARLFGRGNAKSRQDVESLFHRLAESGYQIRPQVSTSVSRDTQYPETFVLDLEIPFLAKSAGSAAGGNSP